MPNNTLARIARRLLPELPSKEIEEWANAGYPVPAPPTVKHAVIRRHAVPQSTFIESGTFHGETALFASSFLPAVITLEPSRTYYEQALARFSTRPRIKVLFGTSEEKFSAILDEVKGGPVTFWLDGHFSGGDTFEGQSHTPIREELAAMHEKFTQLGQTTILVDDVRLFDPSLEGFGDYPTRDYLANWATEHGLGWTIEHDIFVMSGKSGR